MDVKCVFYAEFDLIAGPIILYQYPQQYVQSETFKTIQTFVIPSKALCGNLIIVMLPPNRDKVLICLPSELTRTKYARGSFEFNLGMIVDVKLLQTHRSQLELVLRQTAYLLTVMELEQDFLSSGDKTFLSNFVESLHKKLTDVSFGKTPFSLKLADSYFFHFGAT